MARADLHVHSEFSDYPSEWFLQKIGTRESYTTVDQVYQMAKARGMKYVTITDHNAIEGSLKLAEKYPRDCFSGVEVTTTFPESGCKIHVLVFDLTKEQFQHIDAIRSDIYALRDYIKQEGLAYSVAHATYAINKKLDMETLEKLILLFDVFEGINGARNPEYNAVWTQTLSNLKPEDIKELYQKHHIEPISDNPWIKGFTGGSDDHAGLFIGRTHTSSYCETKEEFLRNIRDKKSVAGGRSNDYKSMVFAFYKIAHEFVQNAEEKKTGKLWNLVNDIVFRNKGMGFKNWLILQKMKRSKKDRDRLIAQFIDHLDLDLVNYVELTPEEKIDRIYNRIADLSDAFFKVVAESVQKDFKKGNTAKVLKNVSFMLSNVFLFAPFFATLRHLNQCRGLLENLRARYVGKVPASKKRVLWFSDTVNDLNGVSVTLKSLMRCAYENDLSVNFAVSLPEVESGQFSPNLINLPAVHSYRSDLYRSYTMHFPSLLKSMEIIHAYNPEEIIISTPGPVGLLGLVAAKLLGIKCTGVYHTDFTRQMDFIVGDSMMPAIFERYTKWFYSQTDEIRVPTERYIHMLKERNYNVKRMKVFKRGVDTALFRYTEDYKNLLKRRYGIQDGFTLITAGRVSKDKNIDFLARVYRQVIEQKNNVNLLIVGNGPDLEELKYSLKDYPRVIFTDMIDRKILPYFYSLADLFVFPSTTDTFGMVVLESQACRLPALVSNIGGPQEIIDEGRTGFVLPVDNTGVWSKKILELADIKDNHSDIYETYRNQARELVERHYSWEYALNDIIGTELEIKNMSQRPKGRESFLSGIKNPGIEDVKESGKIS